MIGAMNHGILVAQVWVQLLVVACSHKRSSALDIHPEVCSRSCVDFGKRTSSHVPHTEKKALQNGKRLRGSTVLSLRIGQGGIFHVIFDQLLHLFSDQASRVFELTTQTSPAGGIDTETDKFDTFAYTRALIHVGGTLNNQRWASMLV